MTVPPKSHVVLGVIENNKQNASVNSLLTWCSLNWKAIFSEFLSTMLLVLFGCMSCIPIDGYSEQPALYAPLGFGLVVMFNVQIFGHISGAQMNPSLTLASVIFGNTTIAVGLAYVIAQCVGAILGYGILISISAADLVTQGVCVTHPHSEYTIYQSLGVEIVLTVALALLCCAIWDPINNTRQDSTALKFGFAIAGLAIAGGPLTGGSMNPARSLGPSAWTGKWDAHWIYWAGPIIGSILATVIYKYTWLKRGETYSVDKP